MFWLPDSLKHQSTCDKLIAEEMSSDEATCLFRDCLFKQANYVESSSDFENMSSLQHKVMTSTSKNISWNTSFDTASSHHCTWSSHQSLRKLDEHVVSSSVSPCSLHAVCDVICCPDRLSLKRDSFCRGSPPINDTDKNGLMRVYPFSSSVQSITVQHGIQQILMYPCPRIIYFEHISNCANNCILHECNVEVLSDIVPRGAQVWQVPEVCYDARYALIVSGIMIINHFCILHVKLFTPLRAETDFKQCQSAIIRPRHVTKIKRTKSPRSHMRTETHLRHFWSCPHQAPSHEDQM